jgi:hypothetical protein
MEPITEPKVTTPPPNRVVSTVISPSPFFLPPLNTNKSFRVTSLYTNSPMNTEQTSPISPTNSSIITRVAAATFNSRNSISTQGNISNNSTTKRISESSSECSSGNNPPSSLNGDTITEIPVIEKRQTRKGSMVFGERRMTIRGWSFNRNRSTTQ